MRVRVRGLRIKNFITLARGAIIVCRIQKRPFCRSSEHMDNVGSRAGVSHTQKIASIFVDNYSKEELATFLAEKAFNDVTTDRTNGKYGDSPEECRALVGRVLDAPPEPPTLAEPANKTRTYTVDDIFKEWAERPKVVAFMRTIPGEVTEDFESAIKKGVVCMLETTFKDIPITSEDLAVIYPTMEKYIKDNETKRKRKK